MRIRSLAHLLVLILALTTVRPCLAQADGPAPPAAADAVDGIGARIQGALSQSLPGPATPHVNMGDSLFTNPRVLGAIGTQNDSSSPSSLPSDPLLRPLDAPGDAQPRPDGDQTKPDDDDRMRASGGPPMTWENLPLYGRSFFRPGGAILPPPPAASVPRDYVLGPGDVLRVHAWNDVNDLTLALAIDRNGAVSLKNAGEVTLWGLSLDQAEALLATELSRQYQDLKLTLSMVSLRAIGVYVVGEVGHPGLHHLNGLSTVMSALHAAGGPTDRGTLRRVELRRPGQPTARFDLYDVLLRGRRDDDARLRDGDLIFVGLKGKEAGVGGYVRRPARFELRGESTLKQILDLAGGLTADAYGSRVQVLRLVNNNARQLDDVLLPGGLDAPIADGDLVRVHQVFPGVSNTVTITGNVQYPGTYEFRPGMRVSDLLTAAGELLPKTYMERADLVRTMGDPVFHRDPQNLGERRVDTEVLRVDLQAVVDHNLDADLPLRPLDRIVVYEREGLFPPLTVRIEGEVRRPGTYAITSGLRVRDLIVRSGGLKRTAYEVAAELGRVESVIPFRTAIRTVHLDRVLAEDPAENITLEPDDRIFIKPVPDYDLERSVTLAGQVRFPGTYLFNPGDRLSTILERAGGFTDRAFLPGATFTRASVRRAQEKHLQTFEDQERRRARRLAENVSSSVGFLDQTEKKVQLDILDRREKDPTSAIPFQANGRIVVHLASDLTAFAATEFNLELEPGDRLDIPAEPAAITIVGEVVQTGSVLFEPARTVQFYLDKMGGATRDADRSQIALLRADGSSVSASTAGNRTGTWEWDTTTGRWQQSRHGSLFGMHVARGDVIFVPGRFRIHRNKSKETIDAVFKSAVSVGALAGLFD